MINSTVPVYADYVPEGLLALIVIAGAMYMLTATRRRMPFSKKSRR